MDLLNRLRSGDELAFKTIFDTYWQSVYNVLLKYTASEADAEELTQDIFYSLWQRREELCLQSELSHYLHGSAKLKAFQHLRNQHRSQQRINRIPTPVETLETRQPMAYKELELGFSQAIDELPEPGKEIFLLSQSERLSQKEIAEKTGRSVQMVKYYVSNARHQLKEKLKHHL
ncbi:sigma-70 family RNA polymerase sigma factor [Chitinophaga horti]|uniref:Sigma-70 family RNA polymerase sigma factor n=1 Tax=Chitinophaga horti TaxID=2920382 RepID=A0ABY6J967_9BACT|nr:sigma-70 family RNA polymerase sigma factor [Chitinophaga horti]UYQ95122.1 sigma-70 family RNA polymerase sigma factor [Chitinophaga horti]